MYKIVTTYWKYSYFPEHIKEPISGLLIAKPWNISIIFEGVSTCYFSIGLNNIIKSNLKRLRSMVNSWKGFTKIESLSCVVLHNFPFPLCAENTESVLLEKRYKFETEHKRNQEACILLLHLDNLILVFMYRKRVYLKV